MSPGSRTDPVPAVADAGVRWKAVAVERMIGYGRLMTVDEVKALPTAQKLKIMEAIWEDFRGRFEQSDIPPRIKDLLDARRNRARAGSAQVVDWDGVKATIGGS